MGGMRKGRLKRRLAESLRAEHKAGELVRAMSKEADRLRLACEALPQRSAYWERHWPARRIHWWSSVWPVASRRRPIAPDE